MLQDTEDRFAHYAQADTEEQKFVTQVAPRFGLAVEMNPAKATDKYTHDLMLDGQPADLKSVGQPFYTAGRHGGAPQYTVTLNEKDVVRYRRLYPDIVIIFHVRFTAAVKYGVSVKGGERIYLATLDEVEAAAYHVHSYQRRTGGSATRDSRGNAKTSLLLDTRKLREQLAPGMTRKYLAPK